MRFTGTSSACSPPVPSASVTVHRSSFGALRDERRGDAQDKGEKSPLETPPSAHRHHAAGSHSGLSLSPLFLAGQRGWGGERRWPLVGPLAGRNAPPAPRYRAQGARRGRLEA